MSKVTEEVARLARPVVEEAGCTLWDVEYVKEAGTWYLRVLIDKEGGLDIEDCVAISHVLDPMLDEADPIPDSYVFEVGSAGCERELKRPSDFQQFLGSKVEVRTYKPVDGRKSFVGVLRAYEEGTVTISVGDSEYKFSKDDTALVKLYAEY